jgi:hypothetical protein
MTLAAAAPAILSYFDDGAPYTMAVGNRHVDVGKALKEAQDSIASAESIEWISAAFAVAQLKPFFKNSAYAAQMRICEHAYAKLVRAKARRYFVGDSGRDDIPVPHVFWWAKGHTALTQGWPTGSFSTYINDIEHRAFGLSFVREDIELMTPADTAVALQCPPLRAIRRSPLLLIRPA